MPRRKWKNMTNEETIADILGCGNVLEDLTNEMSEWRDNLESSEMTHLPKFDEVSEAAETLENAGSEIEQAASNLADTLEKAGAQELLSAKVSYTTMIPYKGRGNPRWMQRDNALAALMAVTEYLEDDENVVKHDDNGEPIMTTDDDGEEIAVLWTDEHDDIESYRSELSDAIEEATNVEFPGMFG